MNLPLICFLLLNFANAVLSLTGPNICTELHNYTLTTRIKFQQPVTVKTYNWCLNIPPRCSTVHTEMRDKWKVQTDHRTKVVQFCCDGFEENDDKCIPKCPEGVTGDKCNEACSPNRWGRSCHLECRCPTNAECDPVNGKCICTDGWFGPSCDLPKDAFISTHQSSAETKQQKNLFDWSTPTMVQTVRPYTTTHISTTTREIEKQTTTSTPPPTTMSSTTQETSTVTEEITTSTIKPTITSTFSTNLSATTYIQPELLTTSKSINASITDSPITVILNKMPKPSKDAKLIPRVTESSIISLTVLKSTAVTAKRKPYKPIKPKGDSDIVKITLNSAGADLAETSYRVIPLSTPSSVQKTGQTTSRPTNLHMVTTKRTYFEGLEPSSTHSVTVPPSDNVTLFTMVTTDIQTEETKHVLTEPEQITSVAGYDDTDENREDLYSALSVAMGVAAALIFVATIIVLVARYRRNSRARVRKMELQRMQAMLNVPDDELPSSYIRSMFHSPLPELPLNSFGIHENKPRYPVPFMQPVIIHAVSPILLENFRDIVESHYDHPKPPRPASLPVSPSNSQKYTTFGTLPSTFQRSNGYQEYYKSTQKTMTEVSFPVTEEAINTLKLKHHSSHILEMERLEPVYDEIPFSSVPLNVAEVININDEAVTEL